MLLLPDIDPKINTIEPMNKLTIQKEDQILTLRGNNDNKNIQSSTDLWINKDDSSFPFTTEIQGQNPNLPVFTSRRRKGKNPNKEDKSCNCCSIF